MERWEEVGERQGWLVKRIYEELAWVDDRPDLDRRRTAVDLARSGFLVGDPQGDQTSLRVVDPSRLVLAHPGLFLRLFEPRQNGPKAPDRRVVGPRKSDKVTFDMGTRSSSPPSSERRGARRIEAAIAAVLSHGTSPRGAALVRDLSDTGALLLVQAPLEKDEELEVSIYLPGSDDAQSARGKVVRCSRRGAEKSDIWTHEAAIAFSEEHPEFAEPAEQAHARQSQLGLLDPKSD